MASREKAICDVVGCVNQHKSLHKVPTGINEDTRSRWMDFIFAGNASAILPKKRFLVCAHHFSKESFSNLGQYKSGFAKHLALNPGAIPSIRVPIQTVMGKLRSGPHSGTEGGGNAPKSWMPTAVKKEEEEEGGGEVEVEIEEEEEEEETGCKLPLNPKEEEEEEAEAEAEEEAEAQAGGAGIMAEAAKNPKKTKYLSEETKKRKRESNKLSARTRVNIGPAFTRWRELKDEEGCPTDGDLAMLLLDYYQKKEGTSSPPQQPPVPPMVSSIKEEPDSDSVHSPSIVKEEERHGYPDEDEVNDPRNNFTEMDENWTDPRLCEDGDRSDEEYAPFLQLHVGGVTSLAANIEQFQEINMDGGVQNVTIPDPTDDEMLDMPDHLKVVHEDDLMEKRACISYHDNLEMLTSFLQFPLKACNYSDRETGLKCPGKAPFKVEISARGTGVVLEWLCPYRHSLWRWNSQPLLKYGMQAGDFMLSTNILLSGSDYRKVVFLFQCMQMGMVAESTYFKVKDTYCIEPVDEFWQNTVKEKNDYSYIPELQRAILRKRLQSGGGLPRRKDT
ncbi:uncharacterized protein LOC133452092 [Cololabis saira]|uniref:uncharacterized protein LOC133452092 n=1 Tax=Cololabis saira TaxID=129043 RepID=UPI002AD42280|nr:uncharacterized protein LOC133452092 [Cololabis saira]